MVKEEEEGEQNIKARIERALNSRLQHFRDNASSFTLASIRRLLEEDLGLEKHALDVHKSFIKQFIEKNLNGDDNCDSKKLEENVGKEVNSCVEVTEGPKKHEMENDLGGVSSKDEAKLEEDSPIMGVLTTKTELASSQAVEISESMIKKAISERADYIKSQSETLTLAGARRFLEEDLKLSKNALDPFKKFIRKQVEEVLNTDDVSTSAINIKKKNFGNRQSKAAESVTSVGRSDSVDSENDVKEHKAKSREKVVQRVEAKKLGTDKKRKKTEKKTDVHKQSKLAKRESGENSDSDNARGASEDGESQSSEEKPVKKKAASTPTFGKNVEHLKSIIKACGMSIAPTVYKKAKQVPDGRREAFLIKELEGILSKEGLSKNPSEKDIKEVRKRKERAKELEGIDMSNIITSSRRRSTMSFVPPPKPTRKDEGGDSATNTSKNKDTRIDDKKKEEPKQEQKEEEEEEPKQEQKEEEEEEPKQVDEEEAEEEEEEEEEDEEESENEEFNEDDVDSD